MQEKIEARLRGLQPGQSVEFTRRCAHHGRRPFDQALRSEAFYADYDLVRLVQRGVEAVEGTEVESYDIRVLPPQREIDALTNTLAIEHSITVRMFSDV